MVFLRGLLWEHLFFSLHRRERRIGLDWGYLPDSFVVEFALEVGLNAAIEGRGISGHFPQAALGWFYGQHDAAGDIATLTVHDATAFKKAKFIVNTPLDGFIWEHDILL